MALPSQVQTFEVAVPYLTEGLSVAQAAGNSNLANLARTGLARAYLGQGKWTEAANAASQVQSGFKWWIPFTDIDGGRNPMHGTSHGGNFNTGIHPWFTGVHPSFNGTGFTFPAANIVAPPVAGALIDWLGYPSLMVFASVMFAVAAVIVSFVRRGEVERKPATSRS